MIKYLFYVCLAFAAGNPGISFTLFDTTHEPINCPSGCDCDIPSEFPDSIDVICENINLFNQVTIKRTIGIVDMSQNHILNLKSESLSMFHSLRILKLQSSGINDIATGTFDDLHDVQQIDLSRNLLSRVDSDMFVHLTKLESLSLSGNKLLHVDTNNSFIRSPSIKELNLNRCFISFLSENSFSELPSLEVLHLSDNKLKYIKLSYFSALVNLQFIDFSNNPWSCQCELIEVLNWLFKRVDSWASGKLSQVTNNVSRQERINYMVHKPIRCLDNKKYKKFWSVMDMNSSCKSLLISATIDNTRFSVVSHNDHAENITMASANFTHVSVGAEISTKTSENLHNTSEVSEDTWIENILEKQYVIEICQLVTFILCIVSIGYQVAKCWIFPYLERRKNKSVPHTEVIYGQIHASSSD